MCRQPILPLHFTRSFNDGLDLTVGEEACLIETFCKIFQNCDINVVDPHAMEQVDPRLLEDVLREFLFHVA
jgi:hypothetical protein